MSVLRTCRLCCSTQRYITHEKCVLQPGLWDCPEHQFTGETWQLVIHLMICVQVSEQVPSQSLHVLNQYGQTWKKTAPWRERGANFSKWISFADGTARGVTARIQGVSQQEPQESHTGEQGNKQPQSAKHLSSSTAVSFLNVPELQNPT